jgi:hypothetical protein
MDLINSAIKNPKSLASSSNRNRKIFGLSPIDKIYYEECGLDISSHKPISANFQIRPFSVQKNKHNKAFSEDCKSYKPSFFRTSPNVRSDFSSRDLMHNLKITPIKSHKKYSPEDVLEKRDTRCKVINDLLYACNNIESSKLLNKFMEKKQQEINNWNKAIDRVTEDLLKVSEWNDDILHHLYYLNKVSNDDICKDIQLIKLKKPMPSVYSVKLSHPTKRNSVFS